MADYGSVIADKAISATARKLRDVYRQAAEELRKKFDDFTKKHKAKQAEMLRKLNDNEITKAAYDSWMKGQVFIGNQWKEKIDQAVKIMANANEEAVKIVQQRSMNVFAENYNYSAYDLEKRARGVVSFNLYNENAVAKLVKENPRMLPEWKINKRKDYSWNRKKVENSVTQGIIQGEGIDQITDRLVDALKTQNENKMRTFARTAVTGAQNAGRQKQMEDAQDLGIKVKKRWVATLDNRTRDTHQELDGQEVDVGKPFEVDGMKIDYPGDPTAEPCLVYNCRCTMIQVYPGIDRKSVRRDEDDNEVVNMTYKEWKEAKEDGTLNTDKKITEPPIGSVKEIEVEKPFTKKEIESIEEYSRSSYSGINTLLREDRIDEYKDVEEIVKNIDSAMEKSVLEENVSCSRGTDFREISGLFGHNAYWYEETENLESIIGKEAEIKAYTSTTVGKKALEQFSQKGVEIVYNVQEGVHAIDVTEIAGTNAAKVEHELLLERGVTVKPTKIEYEADEEGYVIGKIRIFADIYK